MNENAWAVVGIVLLFVALRAVHNLAVSRGRDPMPWLLAAVLFWPVALLWLYLLPKQELAAPVVRRPPPPRTEVWWSVFAVAVVALACGAVAIILMA